MSPVNTLPGLVLKGEFNADSRKHPIWSFFEKCRAWFDAREHDASGMADWYTEDFSMHTPHAERLESNSTDHGYGDDHSFKRAAVKLYTEPLEEHRHVVQIMIALESPDGYDVYSQMVIYANVAGTAVDGEEKVKDEQGREWEVEIPVYYHFDVVKDSSAKHDGLKIRHITTIKDTGVVNDKLDARGVGHKRSIN